MDGLKIYFNFTLPTLLLYNFEREQFRNVMQISPGESINNDSVSSQHNSTTTEEKCGIVSSTTENSNNVNTPTNSQREKESKLLVLLFINYS
jgi:hypothetical protein